MRKRIVSIALAFVLALSVAVTFTGCGNDNYPVEVANITIESEPKNIVVLDASTADIISYTGYDIKMVGRSDEVNQDWLSVVPSVGSQTAPDVNKIKTYETDIVFASENLDKSVKESLEKENIQVITMAQAKTPKSLETNYVTLGKILGGKVTGANKGASSYDDLISNMEQVKASVKTQVNSDILYTVCYLYYENDNLKLMTSGTYGDMLLGYTGAVNAAVNIDENKVDVNTLKVANPNFIFYADEATLNAIKADAVLSKLTAVTSGKALMVTADDMNRQGKSALDTLQKMVEFMYPSLKKSAATKDEASKTTATAAAITPANKQTATTAPANAATTPTAATTSLADKYKIKLDKLSLKYEDENGNVKIMQQRLYDLGYVDDEENITGYYGDISKEAVENFQTKNGIKATGEADNATLVKMFDSSAVKNG
ncbi:MAG: peptidoglycan-binding protein [Ruminococcus sp.]